MGDAQNTTRVSAYTALLRGSLMLTVTDLILLRFAAAEARPPQAAHRRRAPAQTTRGSKQ